MQSFLGLLSLFVGGAAAAELTCPQGFPAPAIEDPGDDVTKLHPAHLRYVAAFGDSITAAFAADGIIPLEFRDSSFSGGVGSTDRHTLQWLLGHYTQPGVPPVTGAASATHVPTEISWKDPYQFSRRDFLNVALSQSKSNAWSTQLARLASQAQQGAVGDGWMAITIFFGENDVCVGLASCGTEAQQQSTVDSFRLHMEDLLTHLLAWRKRLYINLFQLFWLSNIGEKEASSARCEAFEVLAKECECLHGTQFNETERQANAIKVDSVTDRMNQVLVDVARKFDLARPDIGVNVVRSAARLAIPDLSYLSQLDCFHPSLKTNNLAAHAVWNSMLQPSRHVPLEDEAAWAPLCANATTRLMTIRDQLWAGSAQPEKKGGEDVIVV